MPITQYLPGGFSLSAIPAYNSYTVVPHGALDLASADVLHRKVGELRDDGVEHIVLDLRHVDFLDSSGLRVLIVLHNEAQADGHTFTLVAGRVAVHRIFEVTGTADVFLWESEAPGRRTQEVEVG